MGVAASMVTSQLPITMGASKATMGPEAWQGSVGVQGSVGMRTAMGRIGGGLGFVLGTLPVRNAAAGKPCANPPKLKLIAQVLWPKQGSVGMKLTKYVCPTGRILFSVYHLTFRSFRPAMSRFHFS
jgi:hypothetical protein